MKAFKDHPASVNETYFEHMGCAFSFGWTMLVSAITCFIHGVFPFLFVDRGRQTVTDLHHRMVTHRIRNAPKECGTERPSCETPDLTPAE